MPRPFQRGLPSGTAAACHACLCRNPQEQRCLGPDSPSLLLYCSSHRPSAWSPSHSRGQPCSSRWRRPIQQWDDHKSALLARNRLQTLHGSSSKAGSRACRIVRRVEHCAGPLAARQVRPVLALESPGGKSPQMPSARKLAAANPSFRAAAVIASLSEYECAAPWHQHERAESTATHRVSKPSVANRHLRFPRSRCSAFAL